MADSLASCYNWKGTKGKTGFKDTKLCSVLQGTV